MKFIKTAMIVTGIVAFQQAFSQEPGYLSVDSLDSKYLNWYNLDPAADKVQGVSANKAYNELLKGKMPKRKVIVAVIDAGVDVKHPDLQGKIWTNPGEIAGNGIDDDKNGYIDDVHGWNFLGNSKGEDVVMESLEQVRVVKKYDAQFASITSEDMLPEKDRAKYRMYVKAKKAYTEALTKNQAEKKSIDAFDKKMKDAEATLKEKAGLTTINKATVSAVESENTEVQTAKKFLMSLFDRGFEPFMLEGFKENNNKTLNYQLNIDYNARAVIGDNPYDINDSIYGNNQLGNRSNHGTFVAGVIAANRNNGIGTDGIAENVEIMVLRAVPNGDERDKDIALAVRYAVRKGANIINMSFGKDFSPEKELVDAAFKFAEANNVLIVHAAGNSAEDLDVADNFPTDKTLDGKEIKDWLEVGASSKNLDSDLPGSFSNYGKKNVDLFAPGVDMISLAPDGKYTQGDGTSFACPAVSGVAAIVWAYYPELSAMDLKKIIMKSVNTEKGMKVNIPQQGGGLDKKQAGFSDLSITGGTVNAYKALQLAQKKTGKKLESHDM